MLAHVVILMESRLVISFVIKQMCAEAMVFVDAAVVVLPLQIVLEYFVAPWHLCLAAVKHRLLICGRVFSVLLPLHCLLFAWNTLMVEYQELSMIQDMQAVTLAAVVYLVA